MPRILLFAIVFAACMAAPLSAEPSLVIAEIMYHPPDGDEVLEFIEIFNPEPPRVDLSEWTVDGDVTCVFPRGTILLPGKRLVIARSPTLLRRTYNLKETVLPFEGRLNNGGGRLKLVNPAGIVSFQVDFRDDGLWPSTPDGTGHSLSLVDPLLDPEDPASWAPSPAIGGTPGAPNGLTTGYGQLDKRFAASPLRINEVMPSPDGFVEIYNASGAPIDLAGHFLTNRFSELKRYTFPTGVIIAPFGHLALPDRVFGPGFTINADALAFALTDPSGKRVLDCLRADPPATGASASRYPDGGDLVYTCCPPSPNQAASLTPPPDLIITEIMYHPITEDDRDEYIEIYNRSGKTVNLGNFSVKGGISFKFPGKASIGVNRHFVLAKDPVHLKKMYKVGTAPIYGPYKQQLSNSGETIRLLDDRGVLVDQVTYSDSAPWPKWADGLGASLELIHSTGGNDFPGAWGASDSRDDARWAEYTYKGFHQKFRGKSVSEFQFLLLDGGECLIDRVQLVTQSERLIVESFERGALNWQAFGTHEDSGVIQDPDNKSKHCYRLSATNGGDPRNNYVSVAVPKEMKADKAYYLRFRARWQQGSAQLLTRTVGQGMAKTHILPVPKGLGTPGRVNSIAQENSRPILAEPVLAPVSPKPTESARVTVRLDGRPEKVMVHYRLTGGAWNKADMQQTRQSAWPGQSHWTGIIPPQRKGIVEWYVSARNQAGQTGAYPPQAPEKVMMYLSGLACHGTLPTYHLLVANQDWQRFVKRPHLSNKLTHATFVYGSDFIFHNTAFRIRGSPFSRTPQKERNANWRITFGEKKLGGKVVLNMDGQHKDNTRQRERIVHWLLTHMNVPSCKQRFTHFNIEGRQSGLYEDVERIDRNFINRWFPGKGMGNLHKIDDYWEVSSEQRSWVEARFVYKGESPEPYRWNFPARASGSIENFTPFITLTALLDPQKTGNAQFLKQVEKAVNVDEWLRAFAVRTLVDDWDSIGLDRGKNSYIYRTPGEQGLWHLLVWDSDLAFRNDKKPLFSDKFASFKRLLSVPKFRRQFMSYLGYLVQGPMSPKQLSVALAETKAVCGLSFAKILDFATKRQAFVMKQMPQGPRLALQKVQRVPRKDQPDLLRITGTAPCLVSRLTLRGKAGAFKWLNDTHFQAEFVIGPEGGTFELSAEMYGGLPLGRSSITYSARTDAAALPAPFNPAPPTAFAQAPTPLPIYTLDLGDKLTNPGKFAEKPVAQPDLADASSNGQGSETNGASGNTAPADPDADMQHPDPFENLKPKGGDPIASDALPLTGSQGTRSPLSNGNDKPARDVAYIEPQKVNRSLRSIGQDFSDLDQHSQTDPGDKSGFASAADATEKSSGGSLFLILGSAMFGLILLAGIVAFAYYQWKKLSFQTAAAPAASREAPATAPAPAPKPKQKPLKKPAAQPVRPLKQAAPKKPPSFMQDIKKMAGSDFGSAMDAFNRLAQAGNQAVPYLLKAQSLPDNTPFGKIKRDTATGRYRPVAATGDMKNIPVRTVVQFLIKTIRQG